MVLSKTFWLKLDFETSEIAYELYLLLESNKLN